MHTLKFHFARFGLTFGLFWVLVSSVAAENMQRPLDVYLLWAEGCPHCAKEIDFMRQGVEKTADVRVHYLEVSRELGNRKVFVSLVHHFGIQQPGVPLTVIGERYFEGYDDDQTTGADIKEAIDSCLESSCPDIVKPLLSGEKQSEWREPETRPVKMPKILKLPVFGEVSLAQVSLPALTLMLAAVDGFNPCAM